MARVDGKIAPDATKFPNGISGVATQIHALGLKVGIYSDAGLTTCSGESRSPVQLISKLIYSAKGFLAP